VAHIACKLFGATIRRFTVAFGRLDFQVNAHIKQSLTHSGEGIASFNGLPLEA
jgi:hypothetical protein